MDTAPVGLMFLSVMDATFVSMTCTMFVSLGRSLREGIDVAIQLDFFGGAVFLLNIVKYLVFLL